LIPLAALSAAAGAGTGVICGLFRLALENADRFRNLIPQWWQHEPLLGCSLMIAGAALAASLSAYLVRRYSMLSAGSGIPQVELAIHGDIPPAPFILLPVKFFGGLLAIGAGLALGREGVACKWARHLPISSENRFAEAPMTAGRCLRLARGRDLPPLQRAARGVRFRAGGAPPEVRDTKCHCRARSFRQRDRGG
jgi:Voltage gated chloride channel